MTIYITGFGAFGPHSENPTTFLAENSGEPYTVLPALHIWHNLPYMAKKDQVSMNVSMPPPMQLYVKKAVERGQYGTVSEYIRHLIRQDQSQNPTYNLEQKLLSALDSPDSTDPDFFDNLRTSIRSHSK